MEIMQLFNLEILIPELKLSRSMISRHFSRIRILALAGLTP